jgi:hypothetical protein
MDIDGNIMLNKIYVRYRARHVYLIRVAENGLYWLFLVTIVRNCLFHGGWRRFLVCRESIPVCPEVWIPWLLMFERSNLYSCCLYVKRNKVFHKCSSVQAIQVFNLAKRTACRIRIKCWTILFPRRSVPPFYVVVANSVACSGVHFNLNIFHIPNSRSRGRSCSQLFAHNPVYITTLQESLAW